MDGVTENCEGEINTREETCHRIGLKLLEQYRQSEE